MTDIYIDNQRVDTDANLKISISIGVNSIENIQKSKLPYSKTITIPMTNKNMKIMGDPEQINATTMFNQTEHTARIEAHGCTVMEGTPYLIETNINADGSNQTGHYTITIIGAGKEWVKYAAEKTVRNLDIQFQEKITPQMIKDSWTWNHPVKFFPVQRDKFNVTNNAQNIFPPVKIITFEDYHPFIHLKTIIHTIFKNAGYTIKSEFLNSTLFESLYISGNYPKKNVEAIKNKMNFKAGRFQDAQAKADRFGRVYADPYTTLSSIGNLVDTANPNETSEGQSLENVFDYNGCFGKDNKRIVFTPPHEVIIAFEYDITYTTEYYIASRDELKGFNNINLDDGQIRKYKIANRNKDRRTEFKSQKAYTAIIFDHQDGDTYQFRYDRTGQSPETIVNTTFTTRTQNITITDTNAIENPQIWIKKQGQTSFARYTEDWALYDGYVEETGEITVEMTVRSAAERILPSQPKYFDLIYIGGADQGMTLKIHKETTIKPVFAQYPAEGSTIQFYDTAAIDATCLDIINAAKQMFNLMFYTDNLTKQVVIEPRNDFYTKNTIIDWSRKIDHSKTMKVYEPGADIAQTISFEYQTGDATVTKWNHANQQTLGKWTAKVENKQAKESNSSYKNPLFTASINLSGDYPDAPNASLIQAGGRDTTTTERTEELNFTPKIVIYQGIEELPQGQQWGWPANENKYPLIYFHPETENNGENTLCFEDRDGKTGLNKHWKKNISLYNKTKAIEIYIDLQPQDIEPFIIIMNEKNDFRALFRLTIDGENALYRLIEIKEYDPSANTSTKCVFIKET